MHCNINNRPGINASVIILTYNEEKNIRDCLESVNGWVDEIIIVDSYSTDRTLEIVKRYTDRIYQHSFENQSVQINWALDNLPIKTDWIIRLDADEIISPKLKDELLEKIPQMNNEITGLYIKRKVYFMGKWIKHGGYYPTWLLRIWRSGAGYCEKRWMDEHIKLAAGETMSLENDIIEDNKNNISWWIRKHNNYATREAVDLLNLKYGLIDNERVEADLSGTQEQKKRWLKEKMYARSPLFVRALVYFLYRYFLKLGFLDGKEGLIWHFLQGFWYRFLVDAKIYQTERNAKKENRGIRAAIESDFNIIL